MSLFTKTNTHTTCRETCYSPKGGKPPDILVFPAGAASEKEVSFRFVKRSRQTKQATKNSSERTEIK